MVHGHQAGTLTLMSSEPAEKPSRRVAGGLPRIPEEERLLPSHLVVWELQPGWGHSKAPSQVGKDYPQRQMPPNEARSWQGAGPDYQPVHSWTPSE